MLFSGGAPIKEAHHQKGKNQFGITATTKLTSRYCPTWGQPYGQLNGSDAFVFSTDFQVSAPHVAKS
jgi:hypothetical protein